MDWQNAFQAVRHFQLPRTRSLQQALAELHSEHEAVTGELLEVRAALERTRAEDERQIEDLQHRLDHLASDRDSVREQSRLLEDSLREARARQAATERRIASLETQLDDARSQHESNLYLTRDALSQLQLQQRSMMTLQSGMVQDFHETSAQLLNTLREQSRSRAPMVQVTLAAALLFVSGALAISMVTSQSREMRVDLTGISEGIERLQGLMETHYRSHDALLKALNRVTRSQESAGQEAETATPDPRSGAEDLDADQETLLAKSGSQQQLVPDLLTDLAALGLLADPGVQVTRDELESVLARFSALYQAQDDCTAGYCDRLHAAAEQARTDAERYRLDSGIVAAIRLGSMRTGVDFPYMMELAAAESSFDPSARAATTTATGMYQFKELTWLEAIMNYGSRYGLGHYASLVEEVPDKRGYLRPQIGDPELLQRVLDLRLDPHLSAVFAGERVRASRRELSSTLAREPGRTDLYLSHFFGTSGAISFLRAMQEDPQQIAGKVFPGPARRNRGIFQKRNDIPRTIAEVYHLLTRKFNTERYEEG